MFVVEDLVDQCTGAVIPGNRVMDDTRLIRRCDAVTQPPICELHIPFLSEELVIDLSTVRFIHNIFYRD